MIFYYDVKIQRQSGAHARRAGVIHGRYPIDAMDELDELAKGWRAKLLHVRISKVDKDGELVLLTVRNPGNVPLIEHDDKPSHSVTPKWEPPTPMYPLQYASVMPHQSYPLLVMEETK